MESTRSPDGTSKRRLHLPQSPTAQHAWWRYVLVCVLIVGLYFVIESIPLGRATIHISLNASALIAIGALLLLLLGTVAYLVMRYRHSIEAKNAELAANEERLFQFMEHLPVGVFVLDANGSPIFANKLSGRLLGRGIDPNARADELAEMYGAYVAGSNRPYPTERQPIVKALSGTATNIDDRTEVEQRAIESGAEAYFQKPADTLELLQAIEARCE